MRRYKVTLTPEEIEELELIPKLFLMNEDDCHSFLDASDPAVFQTYFTLFLYFGIGSKSIQYLP